MAAVALLTTGLMVAMHAVCLWSALHPGATAARPLGLSLAVFWLATSLVLPRMRRNPLVGIRTTWTMQSDENWARTHRFAGQIGAVGGLVALVGALAGSFPVVVFAMIGTALPSVAYSYLLSRRALDAPSPRSPLRGEVTEIRHPRRIFDAKPLPLGLDRCIHP